MSRLSLLVFAAGKGTRLRPLTERLPKPLVPVLDVPLIDLALARGEHIDWASMFVNVSGSSFGLREYLADHHPGVDILDEGSEPIGQAATLRALLPRLAGTVVTLNCDTATDLDLDALLESHAASGKACTLAVQPVAHGADLVEDPVVRLIDRRLEDRAGFLFLGTACLEHGLLESIPSSRPLGLVAGLLRPAVNDQQVGLYEHRGFACDAGTLDRLLAVNLARLGSVQLSPPPPGVISAEGWYVGPGAEVQPESLGAGAVVMSQARVIGGAHLTRCLVWPGSTVPADAELANGIWFEDRWLPVT